MYDIAAPRSLAIGPLPEPPSICARCGVDDHSSGSSRASAGPVPKGKRQIIHLSDRVRTASDILRHFLRRPGLGCSTAGSSLRPSPLYGITHRIAD